MKNIEIVVSDNNTICVFADTKRYGRHAIMYEGRTFMQCCDYIRRATKKNHFRLVPSFGPNMTMFTDTEGRTMPIIMDVKLS